MLLDDFVSSAIIIDNVDNEMQPLRQMLEARDIHVDTFLYGQQELRPFHRNRQLIFIDIMLNENAGQDSENMSMILNALSILCADDFGLYGLVVWTKHPEKLTALKRRISMAAFPIETEVADDEEEESAQVTIQPPLFVLALNKNKYIRAGYDYSSLPQDIENSILQDPSACFFVEWSKSILSAKDITIKNIYQLVRDYNNQVIQLPYILYRLGLNHTGAPSHHPNVTVDAYKAFDELLYSDITMLQRHTTRPVFPANMQNPFGNNTVFKLRMSAQLNERICIDTASISQDMIVPGNVFIVKEADSPLIVKTDEKPHKSYVIDSNRGTIVPIAIELTPPCDFAQQNKKRSRLVGGYVVDIPTADVNGNAINFNPNKPGDKGYELRPITIGDDHVRCIVFDFRYLYAPTDEDILNSDKYEIWFRAKPKLFADVLQKFSSHASRLGLSNISL